MLRLSCAVFVSSIAALGAAAGARAQPPRDDQQAQIARAALLREAGQLERAWAVLRRLATRRPHDLDVLAALATTWHQAGSPACTHASELLKLTREPETAESGDERLALRSLRLERAVANACEGNAAEALAEVAGVVREGDERAGPTLRRMALAFVQRDELRAANEALSLARAQSVDDESLARDHAAVLLALGQAEQAALALSRAYAQNHDSLPIARDYAAALAAAGLPGDAETVLEAQRASCSREPGCTQQAARAALEAGDDRGALRWLDPPKGPTNTDAQLLRAELLHRLGRSEEARALYEQILAKTPNNQRARQALEALGTGGAR